MGKETSISWCHHTFNGWWGCIKIALECDECYAEGIAERYGHAGLWSGKYRTFKDSHWNEPLKWARDAKKAGIRPRVFTNSMADVFDMAAPESERTRLFELIRATPEMNWLILTKRPGQARRYLAGVAGWPWANVWLGISAGTQKSADAFIPILCEIPAYIRWISHEPILGPINWVNSVWTNRAFGDSHGIHWMVSGGESGSRSRPLEIDYARQARDICKIGDIPWFMKQMGTQWSKKHYPTIEGHRADFNGAVIEQWPGDMQIQDFPLTPTGDRLAL